MVQWQSSLEFLHKSEKPRLSQGENSAEMGETLTSETEKTFFNAQLINIMIIKEQLKSLVSKLRLSCSQKAITF